MGRQDRGRDERHPALAIPIGQMKVTVTPGKVRRVGGTTPQPTPAITAAGGC